MQKQTIATSAILGLLGVAAFLSIAYANHSWGPYHWARTSNPFTLKLGDNVSSVWDPRLAQTASDWSQSSVLDTVVVPTMSNKNCQPVSGRTEVCSKKYGFNGWLGLAQIWITGGEHIVQGVVKLNDSYFNTSKYNTVAWRNLVSCQEVGHTLGLDHQDENFSNAPLGSCMDYSNDPVPNQHPNAHDYEQLGAIYAHLDSSTTLSQSASTASGAAVPDDPAEWGRAHRQDGHGRNSLFERDLGNGNRLLTFVFWAE